MRATAFGTVALTAAALLGLSHTASGAIQTNFVADGVTWEYAYEANELPDGGTPSFSNGISLGSGNRVPDDRLSVINGIYSQDTTVFDGDEPGSGDWARSWTTSSWSTDAPNGSTVELKTAIISDADDDPDTSVFYVRMDGNGRNVWLHFSDGWVGLSSTSSSVATASKIQIDTSAMHTYRVLLTPTDASSVAAELYDRRGV